jgi:hypothetical protein
MASCTPGHLKSSRPKFCTSHIHEALRFPKSGVPAVEHEKRVDGLVHARSAQRVPRQRLRRPHLFLQYTRISVPYETCYPSFQQGQGGPVVFLFPNFSWIVRDTPLRFWQQRRPRGAE